MRPMDWPELTNIEKTRPCQTGEVINVTDAESM